MTGLSAAVTGTPSTTCTLGRVRTRSFAYHAQRQIGYLQQTKTFADVKSRILVVHAYPDDELVGSACAKHCRRRGCDS